MQYMENCGVGMDGSGGTASSSTYIRRQSPTYSDDGQSDSAMTTTLPIGDRKTTTTAAGGNYSKMPASSYRGAVADGTIMDDDDGFGGALTGRNTFAFWTIVCIIFVLTVGNLTLTMSIIGVLRLGKGMEHLELVPEAESIKFFGVTDLDRVYKRDGMLEGFSNVPMVVTGSNGDVQISVAKPNGHVHTKLQWGKNGTLFAGITQLELKSPTDGGGEETIFTTHKPHYNIPGGVDNLHAKIVSASRIASAIDESLSVNNTRGRITFRGTEGVRMEAREMSWSADQNVYLKTTNGTITIEAAGIFIDVHSIPIVGEHGVTMANNQFKLCVCMPQGRLFRVAVPAAAMTGGGNHHQQMAKGACSHFQASHDPCA